MIQANLTQNTLRILSAIVLLVGCNYEESRPGAHQQNHRDLQTATWTCDKLMHELFLPSCAGCHNHGRASGGINLTSIESILTSASRDGNALVTPGSPENSLILQIIHSGEMPPQGDVGASQLKMLECWIRSGAKTDDISCLSSEFNTPNLIIVVEPASVASPSKEIP
jgi:hypothetical protein